MLFPMNIFDYFLNLFSAGLFTLPQGGNNSLFSTPEQQSRPHQIRETNFAGHAMRFNPGYALSVFDKGFIFSKPNSGKNKKHPPFKTMRNEDEEGFRKRVWQPV